MINNIVIIIKKRIGGKYAVLLGDFPLESSENFNLQTAVAQSFFCPIPTSHISFWRYFNEECEYIFFQNVLLLTHFACRGHKFILKYIKIENIYFKL